MAGPKTKKQAPQEVVGVGDFLGNQILRKISAPSTLTDDQRRYYAGDPVAFAVDILGVRPWSKQEEILTSVANFPRVTVRSAHGCGKTFIASVAVLWFVACFVPSSVITTAPTSRQVKSVLWEEIRRLHKSAKTPIGGRLLVTELQMGEKWLATGFATDEYNSDKFQGYHNENMLVVIDEACFDDKTDVLTHTGWKRFKDLLPTDSLLTMNPATREIALCHPRTLFEFDHDGDMVELDQEDCNFCVTPNHNMLFAIPGEENCDSDGCSVWQLSQVEDIAFDFDVMIGIGGDCLARVKQDNMRRVPYKGKVYCAETPPFHTLYVRRNGYCMWSGNSGVARSIYTAVEGLISSGNSHLLLIGNPIDEAGEFGKSFKSALYKKIHISAFDTPNLKAGKVVAPYLVNPVWVEERRMDWGEGNPLYEARVLGNFPTAAEGTLIPLAWAERAKISALQPEGVKVLGADIARYGHDESVMILREGDVVTGMWVWTGNDLMHTTGKIKNAIDDEVPSRINVDSVGLGAGVVDRLEEMGYDISPVNTGERAYDPSKYMNLRTEIWIELRSRFEHNKIRIPDDDKLINQLVNIRTMALTSRGQMRLEPKETTAARIGQSPDRADALALAFMDTKTSRTKELGSVGEMMNPGAPVELMNNLERALADIYEKDRLRYTNVVRPNQGPNCPVCGKNSNIVWFSEVGICNYGQATKGRCLFCGAEWEV